MWKLLYLTLFLMTSFSESKFKSLYCNVYSQDIGEFELCRIKAINRYRNSISVYFRAKQTQKNIMVRVEILKRANGWRPFLFNFTVNVCNFLEKRNNYLWNLGFSYLEPYLKQNYTCPLKANDIIKCDNLELDFEKFRLRFPIETGEYGMRLGFYYKKGVAISINGSAEYSNYREH